MVPKAVMLRGNVFQSGTQHRFALGLALVALLMLTAMLAPALATERIVSDPDQRLALYGYDPVAYQADGEPRVGGEEHELIYQRLVWRFANQGNHDAFAEDPERYIPAYGGHDPYAITRGSALVGHPETYVEIGGRIFLFHSRANLIAFLMEADFHLIEAEQYRPDACRTLAP